jgi:hypothetical protein
MQATHFAHLERGERRRIETSLDAVFLLYPLLAHLDHEEFRVLVLDARNHAIANILLYVGTVDHVSVNVFEVFRPAIVRRRPRILVAHNHPSLDPEPSSEDIELTRQLIEAGELLDIELVDHLVIKGGIHSAIAASSRCYRCKISCAGQCSVLQARIEKYAVLIVSPYYIVILWWVSFQGENPSQDNDRCRLCFHPFSVRM